MLCFKNLIKHSTHHEYQTRHAIEGRFNIPKVRTSYIRRTVIYRAVVGWNSLPGFIIQAKTKEGFKFKVKQYLMIFHELD